MNTEIDYTNFVSPSMEDELKFFNAEKRMQIYKEIELMHHIESEHRERQLHYAMRVGRFTGNDQPYADHCMSLRDYHNKQAAWAKGQKTRLQKEYDVYADLVAAAERRDEDIKDSSND